MTDKPRLCTPVVEPLTSESIALTRMLRRLRRPYFLIIRQIIQRPPKNCFPPPMTVGMRRLALLAYVTNHFIILESSVSNRVVVGESPSHSPTRSQAYDLLDPFAILPSKPLKGGGSSGSKGGSSSSSGSSSSGGSSGSSPSGGSSSSAGSTSSKSGSAPSSSPSRSPFAQSSSSKTYYGTSMSSISAPSPSSRVYTSRIIAAIVVWSTVAHAPAYYGGGSLRPWFILPTATPCANNFYSYAGRCR